MVSLQKLKKESGKWIDFSKLSSWQAIFQAKKSSCQCKSTLWQRGTFFIHWQTVVLTGRLIGWGYKSLYSCPDTVGLSLIGVLLSPPWYGLCIYLSIWSSQQDMRILYWGLFWSYTNCELTEIKLWSGILTWPVGIILMLLMLHFRRQASACQYSPDVHDTIKKREGMHTHLLL